MGHFYYYYLLALVQAKHKYKSFAIKANALIHGAHGKLLLQVKKLQKRGKRGLSWVCAGLLVAPKESKPLMDGEMTSYFLFISKIKHRIQCFHFSILIVLAMQASCSCSS